MVSGIAALDNWHVRLARAGLCTHSRLQCLRIVGLEVGGVRLAASPQTASKHIVAARASAVRRGAGSLLNQRAIAEEAASIQAPLTSDLGSPVEGLGPEAASKAVDASKDADAKRKAEEEERRKKQRPWGSLASELDEAKAQIAEKDLLIELLQKKVLERDQALAIIREELEIEGRLRGLLTKEKKKAEQEAALAQGLCTGRGFP